MKRFSILAALALLTLPALATDVGVSVTVGEPGFYGRIDIGSFPQPRVIYREPIIVHRSPVIVHEPIYLHVPPGHAKNWRKHCGRYDACGRRVYFVQDRWYNDVYVPRYRDRHGRHDDDRYDRPGKHDRDDKHDKHPGKGHGRGNGKN